MKRPNQKNLSAKQKAHRAYLLTDHWKTLRAAALERDGNACTLCGRVKGEDGEVLQVHHLKYRERLEDGVLEDITTLCQTCHRIEHSLPVVMPFDKKLSELERKVNYEEIPSKEEVLNLFRYCFDQDDENKITALIRRIGMARLTSAKWTSWLKKPPQVSVRFWHWADREFQRLKKEFEKAIP